MCGWNEAGFIKCWNRVAAMILKGAEDAEVQGSDLLCVSEHRQRLGQEHWLTGSSVPQLTSSLQHMGQQAQTKPDNKPWKTHSQICILNSFTLRMTHKPE